MHIGLDFVSTTQSRYLINFLASILCLTDCYITKILTAKTDDMTCCLSEDVNDLNRDVSNKALALDVPSITPRLDDSGMTIKKGSFIYLGHLCLISDAIVCRLKRYRHCADQNAQLSGMLCAPKPD